MSLDYSWSRKGHDIRLPVKLFFSEIFFIRKDGYSIINSYHQISDLEDSAIEICKMNIITIFHLKTESISYSFFEWPKSFNTREFDQKSLQLQMTRTKMLRDYIILIPAKKQIQQKYPFLKYNHV